MSHSNGRKYPGINSDLPVNITYKPTHNTLNLQTNDDSLLNESPLELNYFDGNT